MAKIVKKKNVSVRYYTKPKDYLYMALVHILCAVSVICIMIPLIYVVAASFSSPKALLSGRVFLLPVDFTLRGYKMLLQHQLLVTGFGNSLLYTVVGTVINLVMTVLAAYPLSRKDLAIRNPIMLLFTFTMLFNGGMIPTYIILKSSTDFLIIFSNLRKCRKGLEYQAFPAFCVSEDTPHIMAFRSLTWR